MAATTERETRDRCQKCRTGYVGHDSDGEELIARDRNGNATRVCMACYGMREDLHDLRARPWNGFGRRDTARRRSVVDVLFGG